MRRRELFKLGLAAGIAHALPKPKVMTHKPKVRISIGGHGLTGFSSGEFVQIEAVQHTRSYNHVAVTNHGEKR